MVTKGSNIDKIIEKAELQDRLNMYRDGLAIYMEIMSETKEKVIITLDGRDSAGKGYNSRKFTEFADTKLFKINTFGIPTEFEKNNWFNRYIDVFPKNGNIAIYDRSWYNRGLVEPVMGFCSKEQYEEFMANVVEFEKSIIDRGILLNKFYLSISKKTQEKRLGERSDSPRKRWKQSGVDAKALEKWDQYTYAKRKVLEQTDSKFAPWSIIKSNTRESVIEILKKILSNIENKSHIEKIQNEIVDIYGESLDLKNNPDLFRTAKEELDSMKQNKDKGKKFDFLD